MLAGVKAKQQRGYNIDSSLISSKVIKRFYFSSLSTIKTVVSCSAKINQGGSSLSSRPLVFGSCLQDKELRLEILFAPWWLVAEGLSLNWRTATLGSLKMAFYLGLE